MFFIKNKIFSFFIFISFFPTIRLLLLGKDSSSGFFSYLFSALPEIIYFSILIYYGLISKKRLLNFKFALEDYFLLFFVALNLILGIILANDLKLSVYAIKLSYIPISAYLFMRFELINKNEFIKQINNIFGFFTFVALLGIILYFIFPSIQFYFLKLANDEIQAYFIIRMTSIIWSPVVFGTIISTSILFFYFKILKKDNKLYWLYLMVLFICLIMSVSRGAIISIFLGIILISIVYKNMKKLLLVLGLFSMVFIMISYYISTPKEFLNWMLSSTSETLQMEKGNTRAELWMKAIQDIKSKPFGYGLGKAGHVAARFYDKNSEQVSASSTDGWYLKLMNESGIIGLVIFLMFIYFLIFKYLKKYNLNKTHELLPFIFILLIMYSIQNIVSNVLDFPIISYLFYLLLGYFVLEINKHKNASA